jgi:lipoate-protein ligase A
MTAKWWIWHDVDRSPYLNMAIDELLLQHSHKWQEPLIRLYGWNCPSVSIGYVQNFTAAPQNGYKIVRRPTGGGVVLHDNDFTYTIIVPVAHPVFKLERIESYHVFHRAIKNALAELGKDTNLSEREDLPVDRATMQCFSSPTRYDVVADGIKFAGAAQRRTKNGILHQGSIKLAAADGNKNKLADFFLKNIKSEFSIQFEEFHADNDFMNEAETLSLNKYATPAWNMSKMDK